MYAVSIEKSIERILRTPLGSRVMRPHFGSRLYELRDREMDFRNILLLKKYIFEAILTNEPRVELEDVEFIGMNNGKFNCKIILRNKELELEV